MLSVSAANAQLEDFRDDFGDDANPHAAQHHYSTGVVLPGGFWDGVHNATNGGGVVGEPPQLIQADFVADGFNAFGESKAGKLLIEDLNLHQNEDGSHGVGWDSIRTNAPFLFRDVPAKTNFVARMKIDAQTAGNWSYAPMIVRLKNEAVGLGPGDVIPSFANFVTAGSFRANASNPDQTRVLTRSVKGGFVNLDMSVPNVTGLPLWIQLEKVGSKFHTSYSLNGTNFQFAHTVTNTNLNHFGETLEVGPSFMMEGGGEGRVEIDYFELYPLIEECFSKCGDFNDDNVVDSADYVVLLKNYGTDNILPNDYGYGAPIDLAHFELWQKNFGNTWPGGSGGGQAATAPEPAALAGVALMCLLGSGFRRRAP
jgi:hypothetical protein